MTDSVPWYRRVLITVLTAALMIGLILGGAWLSTHQESLQGSGPIIGVVMLAAMVYGARGKKKR